MKQEGKLTGPGEITPAQMTIAAACAELRTEKEV